MNENPFVGIWTVTNPGNLEGLTEITIEESSATGSFTISAPAVDLFLPGLAYDTRQEVLTGRCQGRVGGPESTYLVAVVRTSRSPEQCTGIVFSAGGDQEDNSIGSWTADKRGGAVDPPE